MRYWWVNQNRTFHQEVKGGYMWSPKRKTNGSRNPFYEFMREVAPGDLIFSFADLRIKALGLVRSHAYEAPKPLEFGTAGAHWDQVGWRVEVSFRQLTHAIKPASYMERLAPLLPRRYAPLQPSGRGQQSVYLTELAEPLAFALADIIGHEAHVIIHGALVGDSTSVAPVGLVEWEEHQLEALRLDSAVSETTRQAIIQARRGHGVFKQRVMQIEHRCRVTGVDRAEHLRASHCKPWRDSDNAERLDGENGLLLTPDADHLFDRGFLSFEDSGEVLVSPVAHVPSLEAMGLGPGSLQSVGRFSQSQCAYLAFHRENVFLQARLKTRL